jgi:Fe-S-cluster containining protein
MPLPPTCHGCGRCCVRTGPHLDVYVGPGELVPWSMTEEVDGLRLMRRTADRSCVALDPRTRLCTIYDQRPWSCRELQRGDPDCLAACADRPAEPGDDIDGGEPRSR